MSIHGDTAASGGTSARVWVRRMLLNHVPEKGAEATVAMIAARAEIAIEAARDHLACMVTQVDTVSRAGRLLYYRRPAEDDMAEADYPDSLTKRITKILEPHGDGRTTLALAHLFHVRPNKVSDVVRELVNAGVVRRTGKGKRGDPYRFFLARVPGLTADGTGPPTDEGAAAAAVESLEALTAVESLDALAAVEHLEASGDASTGTNEAASRPLTDKRDKVDTLLPPDSAGITDIGEKRRDAEALALAFEDKIDPAELAHCYACVMADLLDRAKSASDDATAHINDAKVLSAACTLLGRILDGEADR